MRGGVILIALGLLIGYLGVTGRYKCFSVFLSCLSDPGGCACGLTSQGATEPAMPGKSGNPTGGGVYDATDPAPIPLLPIEPFI